MYNTAFECRYHRYDVFIDTDNVTEKEKEFIRNILYKEDLLNVFVIDFNDDFETFVGCVTELYDRLKGSEPFKDCMRRMASTIMSDDEPSGLMLMYSYDHMHITHACVTDYLVNGTLTEESKRLLSSIQP